MMITYFIAAYQKIFRAPDATDLYGYSGNANLKPEKSITYEIGSNPFQHWVTLKFQFGMI